MIVSNIKPRPLPAVTFVTHVSLVMDCLKSELLNVLLNKPRMNRTSADSGDSYFALIQLCRCYLYLARSVIRMLITSKTVFSIYSVSARVNFKKGRKF
jgi:hypothetical protein